MYKPEKRLVASKIGLEVIKTEIHVLITIAIAAVAFALIFSGKVHRAIAAWGASIALLVVGKYYGFLDEAMVFSFIDFNVIGLLLGMMTIASMLEISGFFEFIAIRCAKIAGGKPWLLIVLLGTGNTVISLFIDNVTSIILLAPVTIMLCRRLGISPVPILMSEALLADTGGVGTLVGDPPNIMIAAASGFGFNEFPIRLGPAVFTAWLITIFYLLWYYRTWTKKPPEKIEELLKMNEWDYVKDRPMMYKTLAALLFTISIYVLNDFIFHLNVATVALVGAGLALCISLPDIYKVTERVEWPALLFFAGLYILVGSIEELGLLAAVGYWMVDMSGGNMTIATVMFIWVSAIASAIVDNIPFTAAMLPVISEMGALGMATTPLYWALAMGVGFGGNGTPIGSTANVVTISIAERKGYPITMGEWLRVGTPVMILTCTVATVFMVLFPGYYM
ncbi:MAG: ArsB/NhaD family transporter [Candidatus Hydrothermarchaeaceae archaeon]